MNPLAWISSIFKPAADLIDNLHTSTEEKMKLTNELARIRSEIEGKTIDLMKTEAQSNHALAANWRPACSILIVIALVLDGHFGYHASPNIYGLAEIFLGTYAGGRSLEKIAGMFKK